MLLTQELQDAGRLFEGEGVVNAAQGVLKGALHLLGRLLVLAGPWLRLALFPRLGRRLGRRLRLRRLVALLVGRRRLLGARGLLARWPLTFRL